MRQVVKSFLILSSQLKIFLFMKNGGQLSPGLVFQGEGIEVFPEGLGNHFRPPFL